MGMKEFRKRKLQSDDTSFLEDQAVGGKSKKPKVDAPVGTAADVSRTDGNKSKSSKRRRRREKLHSCGTTNAGEGKSVLISASDELCINAAPQTTAMQESSGAAAKRERHPDLARKQRKKAKLREKRMAAKAAKASVSATATSTIPIWNAASVTDLVRPRDKVWHDEKPTVATGEVNLGARRTKPVALSTPAQRRPLDPAIDWAAIEREAQKRIRQPDVDWSLLSSKQIRDLEHYYIGGCRVEEDQISKPFEEQAKVADDTRSSVGQDQDELTQRSGNSVSRAPRNVSSQIFRTHQKSEGFQPYRERRLSGVPATTSSGNLLDTAARFQRFSQMVNGSDSSDSESDASSAESEGERKTQREDKMLRGSIQESFADEMFKTESENDAATSDPESDGNFDKSAADEAARQYESYMRSRTTAGASSVPVKTRDASSGCEMEEPDLESQSTGVAVTHEAIVNGDVTTELRGCQIDDGSEGEKEVHHSSAGTEENADFGEESQSSDDDDQEPTLAASIEAIDEVNTAGHSPVPPKVHNTGPQTTGEHFDSGKRGDEAAIEKVDRVVAGNDLQEAEEAETIDLLDGLQRDLNAMPRGLLGTNNRPKAVERDEEECHAISSLEQLGMDSTDVEPEVGKSHGSNEQADTRNSHLSQGVSQTGIPTEPSQATAANIAVKKRSQSREAGGPPSMPGHSPNSPARVRPEHKGSYKHGVDKTLVDRDTESLYSELESITHEVFSTTRAIGDVEEREPARSVLTSAEQTNSELLPAEIRKAMEEATASLLPTSASKRKMTGMTSKHFSPAKFAQTSIRETAGIPTRPDESRALSNLSPVKTFDQVPERIAYVDLGLTRKRPKHSSRSAGLRNDDRGEWRRQGIDAEAHVQQHMPSSGVMSDGGIEIMPSVTRAQRPVQTPKHKRAGQGAREDHAVDASEQPDEGYVRMLSPEPTPSRKRKSPAKKTSSISEHFIDDRVDLYNTTAGKRRRVAAGESANPFPPIDKPFFGIIQERTCHEPFWLIIATVFLNKTTGRQAAPTFWKIRQRWPQPQILATADPAELFDMIAHLGLQNQRTKRILQLAAAWTANPPVKGHRTRKLNYPDKGDGKQWKKDEIVEQDADDCAGALEIAHIPGCGAYAYDSWRIFCRDVLRGVATDYKGANAKSPDFEPEWKRVLPADKELRACLRWMWLKEGWIWNPSTGEKRQATEEEMEKARKGEVEVEDEDERKFAAQATGAEVQSPEKTRRGDDALDETPTKNVGSTGDKVDQGSDWALQNSQAESAQPDVLSQSNTATYPPVRQTRGSSKRRKNEETSAPVGKSEAPPVAKKAKNEAVALKGKRRSTRHSARLVTKSGIQFNMLTE